MAYTQAQLDFFKRLAAFTPAQRAQWNAFVQAQQPQAANQNALAYISSLNPADRQKFQSAMTQLQAAKKVTAYPVQINEADYAGQKADLNAQYGTQLAGADYAAQIARQRQARAVGDFNINAYRQRETVDNPYLRRGIFNSGIRRKGLSRLREDQARGYGGLMEQNAQELGQIAQQRAGIQTAQQSALHGVDRARQRAIQQQLASLRAGR